MHYLSETNIFLFLTQVFLLLGAARILGDILRRFHQPALPAEIAVGVFFGPTVLGRISPAMQAAIFPNDPIQNAMLDTLAWFGVFYLLLETGLEIDLLSAWRQRSEVLKIALADIIIPMAAGAAVFSMLPLKYFPDPGHKILFILFLASVIAISAMPITARALSDLKLNKTDLGSLIMSALSVNDLIGWLVFAVILGFSTRGELNAFNTGTLFLAIVGFTVASLTLGRRFTHAVIAKIKENKMPEPGSSLTFLSLLGLFCGAVTHRLGINAVFGFFLAGIMAGDARALPEKSRQIISQMVYAIFIPLFFAGIGLKIDFLKNFDLLLVLVFTVLGIAAKFLGAWVGVSLTNISRSNRLAVAIAHTSGGMMEIVVGLVALDHHLISEPIFTALVCGVIVSSVLLGPWMSFAVSRRREVSVLEFFNRRGIIEELKSSQKNGAITELCGLAADHDGLSDPEEFQKAVLAREGIIGTAVESGLAVPHGRIAGLKRPIVVFGRSLIGIDWDSPDGEPTRFVFLILTPANDEDVQVQILRAITRVISQGGIQEELLNAAGSPELWNIINREFTVQQIIRR